MARLQKSPQNQPTVLMLTVLHVLIHRGPQNQPTVLTMTTVLTVLTVPTVLTVLNFDLLTVLKARLATSTNLSTRGSNSWSH